MFFVLSRAWDKGKILSPYGALAVESLWLRPGSDAVLQPSRIKFNELSSCEVEIWRLNQFGTADLI